MKKTALLNYYNNIKTRWQSRLSGSGHSYAMQIASRNCGALAQRDYQNTGLGAFELVGGLVAKVENDEVAYDALIVELKAIHRLLLQAPKYFIGV